ncbi:transposase [Gluconobacter cerinus]|nr:transposase [Gluconobacter cerinus]
MMQSVFSDDAWSVWESLIETVRPKGKTPPRDLRRTISAIFWRHQNGTKWWAIPAELGPGGLQPNSSSVGQKPASGRLSLNR